MKKKPRTILMSPLSGSCVFLQILFCLITKLYPGSLEVLKLLLRNFSIILNWKSFKISTSTRRKFPFLLHGMSSKIFRGKIRQIKFYPGDQFSTDRMQIVFLCRNIAHIEYLHFAKQCAHCTLQCVLCNPRQQYLVTSTISTLNFFES